MPPVANKDIPLGDGERRRGKWTLKLLAAHYIYHRVTGDDTIPSTTAACSAAMDRMMSMRSLGRMAVYWKVARVSSIQAAVFNPLWDPDDLHEVAKAYIWHYCKSTSLSETLNTLLTEYFEASFEFSTKTSSSTEKRIPAMEVEEEVRWADVVVEVLKELRLVEPKTTTGLAAEGWMMVSDLITRVSRKYKAIIHTEPAHFMSRVREQDGMMKLQELTGQTGEHFMRATYCHRNPLIAASVLASHVRVGAMPAIRDDLVLYSFVENSMKIDPVVRDHGLQRMVPFRPMVLMPEKRVVTIRRRCVTDPSYAKCNKVVLGKSAFVRCMPDRLNSLIIRGIPQGVTPASEAARDVSMEEVVQQYFVSLPQSLREVGGVVTQMETASRCYALIPVSFGEAIPHLFRALAGVDVEPEDIVNNTKESSSAAPLATSQPVSALISSPTPAVSSLPPPHTFPSNSFTEELAKVKAWLGAGANAELGLVVSVGSERKALSRLRAVFGPIVDEFNSTLGGSYTVVMHDSLAKPELVTRVLGLQQECPSGSTFIAFYRAPSPHHCIRTLAADALQLAPEDDIPLYFRELIQKVLHPTRYETLEFLGDAVIDYIVARRLWSRQGAGGDALPSAIGKEVSRETNNAILSERLPMAFRLYLEWVMGRSIPKHFADAYEAIVGALYLYGMRADKDIEKGLELAQRFVDSSSVYSGH